MHINECQNGGRVRLILLAHQDDEIFMLPFIDDSTSKTIIYLTSGVSRNASQAEIEIRYKESQNIFEKYLRPRNCTVVWWGNKNSHPEGELHKFSGSDEIKPLLSYINTHHMNVTEIVTTAFEGAHQDHDSAACISRKLGEKLNLVPIEVATYPQKFNNLYSYQVLTPKFPKNIINLYSRKSVTFLALQLIIAYKSQRLTWLGLGMQTIFNYAFKSFKVSQSLPITFQSPCFYEYRGRANQKIILSYLRN
jgi:hypothetical protein